MTPQHVRFQSLSLASESLGSQSCSRLGATADILVFFAEQSSSTLSCQRHVNKIVSSVHGGSISTLILTCPQHPQQQQMFSCRSSVKFPKARIARNHPRSLFDCFVLLNQLQLTLQSCIISQRLGLPTSKSGVLTGCADIPLVQQLLQRS